MKTREQTKQLREQTNKVNAATFFKKKGTNPVVNKRKAGQTTRAVQAIDEKAKEKALKEFVKKQEQAFSAKDENNLSKYISVQIGNCHYILKRAKYNTPEKIKNFIDKKREESAKWIQDRKTN